MTIEEKAKSYDEALEKAKICLKDGTITSTAISYIETIFPELKESEEEKVRKEIINYFQCQSRDEPLRKHIHDKWIAWLEKQKPTDNDMVEALRIEYEKGRYDAIAEMQEEWRDEDGNFFANICTIINADRNFTESAKRRCKDWLKSLKDRVQPKQEWSEDDEKRLQSCINILKAKSLMGKVDTANTMWLKSLKQRIGWKPSDEQMELLKDASARYESLESLYNDLKKLKS